MTPVHVGMPSARDAPRPRDRPDTPDLIDQFGRTARDLRVSITEKCSLRCRYCMPEAGLPPIEASKLLTPGEIARLVGVAVHRLGVREIRFTGGEPLMRRDLEQIIRECRSVAPHTPIAATTNAVGLEHRARTLVEAGLDRLNVSLDTIDQNRFAHLTRRDRLDSVLTGIRAAQQAGLSQIKINAVLMPDTLDGSADLLSWCLDAQVELRFIEQMPLDAERAWARTTMVTAQQLLEVLRRRFDLIETRREDPSAPAERWIVNGGRGVVGIIASVTRSFCSDCDRTRLTAEGTVRSCLFSDRETDLRTRLREGASDEELADAWRAAMWSKSAGHAIEAVGFVHPVRSMGAIGG
ncbi:GTP 3',8-cyclase MoaA [Rhodococcus jostii]|uniref:GTP 3',8-cyclase MoaA n=1 Tax=Rhodococcus jostii TaxID=132919 RepID=UPI003657757D